MYIIRLGEHDRFAFEEIQILGVIIYHYISINYGFVATEDDLPPAYKREMFMEP